MIRPAAGGFFVEEVMTEQTAAQAADGAPAEGETIAPVTTEAVETTKPAGEKPKPLVSLIDDDEPAADDDDGDETDAADGEGDKPKPKSRSQRQAAKIARQAIELEELRRIVGAAPRAPAKPEAEKPATATGSQDPADALEKAIGKPPKESDFPNDYLAYADAMAEYRTNKAAFKAAEAVRDEHRKSEETNRAAQDQERADKLSRLRLTAYNERLDEVRDRIPDFDKVVRAAGNTEIRDDVRDLVLESPKGPLLAYHLAQNPDKVDDLNRMSPVQAAREIGRLEARIRGPQPAKATKAPPPVTVPKGGAAKPSGNDPSTMSMEEYTRAMEAGEL
jgi:hypothetical protein